MKLPRPPHFFGQRKAAYASRDEDDALEADSADFRDSDEEELDLSAAAGETQISRSRLQRLPGSPTVLGRSEHCISRRDIDPDALKVLRRLIQNRYHAFLVGGAVRDLLLRRKPKDYDVGTDASPEEVRTLFRNSRIIGRRFRINHVYFRANKIIEVSTFRASSAPDEEVNGSLLAADNTYGDPQTDAVRRDITINGLFYDLSTFSVIDYVGGIEDLRDGIIRIIGDPEQRIQEDPVRMIRVVRHAARTGFRIEENTYQTVCRLKALIKLCPLARIHEEFLRDLRGGSSKEAIQLLYQTGLLSYLMPVFSRALDEDYDRVWERLEPRLVRIDRYCSAAEEELPTSVLMLSLLLGNLPPSYTADPSGEELLRYWQYPASKLREYQQEQEAIEEEPEAILERIAAREQKRERGWASRRGKVTNLGKMIARVCEIVGVPRRERERIEAMLVARSLLIAADESLSPESRRRLYSNDLALLAEVIGEEDVMRPAAEQNPGGRSGRQRRGRGRHNAQGQEQGGANERRRRRRPRRRGHRPANQGPE